MKRLVFLALLLASFAANSASTLLFKSGFGSGTTINAPTLYGNNTGGNQTITGTDTESGFSWSNPLYGSTFYIQNISCLAADACVTPLTAAKLAEFNVGEIQSVTGPHGNTTNALYKAALGNYAVNQTLMMLNPSSPPTTWYISFWIKYPADFFTKMGAGNYQELTGWKTSGDFRQMVQVENYGLCGSAVAFYALYWDNVANGGLPYQQFLSSRNCTTTFTTVDQWHRLEMYSHRDNVNGRVIFTVNGTLHTDYTGDNIGVNSNSINRIYPFLTYGSSMVGETHLVDNLEVWNGLPDNPSLTSQTVASVDNTSGTPQVTTDSPGGTLYMVVVPNLDFDSLTNAQRWTKVKAGQQGSGAAAIAAEKIENFSTGAKSFAQVTGLTAGTDYDAWFCHWTTGTPNCVKADFQTTATGGGGTPNYVPFLLSEQFEVEFYRVAANDAYWQMRALAH